MNRLSVVTVFAVVLLSGIRAAEGRRDGVNSWNVCTAEFVPMVRCNENPEVDPVGYHIELFKVIG